MFDAVTTPRASTLCIAATSEAFPLHPGLVCGRDFGAGLSQAEVDYLRAEEWALTAEDMLWRRTKLGLRLSAAQQAELADYLGAALGMKG